MSDTFLMKVPLIFISAKSKSKYKKISPECNFAKASFRKIKIKFQEIKTKFHADEIKY